MAKYYAVRVGARTGVFMSWEECQKAVDGFSGAKFKKFRSLEEAERFIYDDNDSKPIKEELVGGYINAYVDGSYDSSTGRYSGAAVILLGDNDIVELSKACKDDSNKLRNVAGELLGGNSLLNTVRNMGSASLLFTTTMKALVLGLMILGKRNFQKQRRIGTMFLIAEKCLILNSSR